MSFTSTWSKLRPHERRIVMAVGVLLFVVINVMWVWPRFQDWKETQTQLKKARNTLDLFNAQIKQTPENEKRVKELEMEGASVPADEQANQFLRTVQIQAGQSGVSIMGTSRQTTKTNQFFMEQLQTFTVQAGEEQLVDFLYNLGSSESMIRARGLSVRPNPQRQQLQANIDLVASYQKKPAARPVAPAGRTTTAAAGSSVPTTARRP